MEPTHSSTLYHRETIDHTGRPFSQIHCKYTVMVSGTWGKQGGGNFNPNPS